MYPREKLATCLFISALMLAVLIIPAHFATFNGEPYEIKVIRSHLMLALDTHNIDAKVKYIDDTVESLKAHSGNGNWWFPNHLTDVDQTRMLLSTISSDVYQQKDVKDREHYFMIPHNELVEYLNSEIIKAEYRLEEYQSAVYWNPNHSILLWVIFLAIPIVTAFATIMIISGTSRRYQNEYDEKQAEKMREKERREQEQRHNELNNNNNYGIRKNIPW